MLKLRGDRVKAAVQFLWNKLVASTVTQAVKLVGKARARRVLILGENTNALSDALEAVVEQLDVIDDKTLSTRLSASCESVPDSQPVLTVADGSYDLCLVSFALHKVEPEVAEKLVRDCLRVAPNALLIDFALAERNIELPSQYICSFAEQFLHGGHWEVFQRYIRVGALHGIAHRASASEFANVIIWGGGVRLLLVG